MVPVFLGRLQSGFLLFETQQGFVRVELSFGQRVYLLWTFRNFRQLPIPLLNSRQRALVNTLFRNRAGVVSDSPDSSLAIGVVENFVPLTVRSGASPAPKKERQEEKRVVAPRAEIAPKPKAAPRSSTRIARPRLATTVGVLSLCAISVMAWHRIQGIPGSQAHDQPRPQQVNGTTPPNSSRSRTPSAIGERPAAIVPSEAIAQPHAVAKSAVQPASIATRFPGPKQEISIPARASTPNLQLSGQDSRMQASRPPLRFVYPVYPDVLARGVVALTARVDSDGTVRSVRVVSGNRALAAVAVRAVRQWRYRPYLEDGQPVATETNIVISFISDDAISMSFPPSLPLAEAQPAKHTLSGKLK